MLVDRMQKRAEITYLLRQYKPEASLLHIRTIELILFPHFWIFI
jgi:hypothetical protein